MTTDPASFHLSELLSFLRFPSISADSTYRPQLLNCADWVVKKLQSIGLQTELWPTQGNPVIMARKIFKSGRPTFIIYGHYDVQPADPLSLWKTPPFEPSVENGIITARGASDN